MNFGLWENNGAKFKSYMSIRPSFEIRVASPCSLPRVKKSQDPISERCNSTPTPPFLLMACFESRGYVCSTELDLVNHLPAVVNAMHFIILLDL